MNKTADRRRGLVRGFSVAAAAILALTAAPGQRAEALSPLSAGTVPTAKYASDGLTTEVRHGGVGGRGGGGFHGGGGFRGGGGGFHGGGFRGGGAAFHGGGFRSGGAAFHGGGFRHGGAAFHGGGFRHGGAVFRGAGFHHGGHRFAHHRFVHRHHFHRRFYVAPAYYYGPRRYCRIVWTYYGPRKICRYRPWHNYWGYNRFYRSPIYW